MSIANTLRIKKTLAAILLAGFPCFAIAFDPSRIVEGTYYNGTNVNMQFWSPLVVVKDGKLLDPFERSKTQRPEAFTGSGRTSALRATSAFLYGGCRTGVELQLEEPLIASVPTVFVNRFTGEACARQQSAATDDLKLPPRERADPIFPTILVQQPLAESKPLWLYGVPGILTGNNIPISPKKIEELNGVPQLAHAVVSRSSFVTLPIVEPDLGDLSLRELRQRLHYSTDPAEASHRMNNAVLSADVLNTAKDLVRNALWHRFYPKLERSLRGRFGGISRSYFELGLIQAVDIDNTRSVDFIGVARIGALTEAGPWRWIDIVWSWRSARGRTGDAIEVIRTSEDALYKPENHYFEEAKHPSLWSPNLVISGFADFDKDKTIEIVTSLVSPAGIALDENSAATRGVEIWLRESAIHAWIPHQSGAMGVGHWTEVFRTSVHEARVEHLDIKTTHIDRFGE